MTDGDRSYWDKHARNYDRSMSLLSDAALSPRPSGRRTAGGAGPATRGGPRAMPGHLRRRRVVIRLKVLSFLARSCSRGVMVALVALILVAQVASVPHAVAAMFSDLCCEDCAEDGDCGESHERDCDCPLGCKTCCAQASPIATLGSPAWEAAPHSFIDRSPAFGPLLAAPRGVRADILHVPKATSSRFSPQS